MNIMGQALFCSVLQNKPHNPPMSLTTPRIGYSEPHLVFITALFEKTSYKARGFAMLSHWQSAPPICHWEKVAGCVTQSHNYIPTLCFTVMWSCQGKCVFFTHKLRLSMEYRERVSINALVQSKACFCFDLGLTWGLTLTMTRIRTQALRVASSTIPLYNSMPTLSLH